MPNYLEESSTSVILVGSVPVIGTPSSGFLGLYINGGTLIGESGTLDILTFGATSGSTYINNSIDLYLNGESRLETLNLFVNAITSGDLSSNLNIYLNSVANTSQNTLDIYTCGGTGSGIYSTNYINIWASGYGINDGFYPYSGSMDLFIRASEGCINTLDINVLGKGSSTAAVDIMLNSISGIISNSLDLYVGSYGTYSHNLPIFTRGWRP